VVQQRSHKTLERLCGVIANRLLADYELESVWVKATKPEPPIPLTVDEVSVEVWRESDSSG
jgi:dihydroneopterin aldolase